MINYGLYKCKLSGKMAIEFGKENHGREKHKGKIVEEER